MADREFVSLYRGPVRSDDGKLPIDSEGKEVDCMTRYFRVYPLPGEKRGGQKRSPGRPRVYNLVQRKMVAAALRKHGLTKGIEWLCKERGLKVSVTLARAVAEENGITFTLGRPKLAA